jgi:hypothetical protein
MSLTTTGWPEGAVDQRRVKPVLSRQEETETGLIKEHSPNWAVGCIKI